MTVIIRKGKTIDKRTKKVFKKIPKYEGPAKMWCQPKLLYSKDGNAILTSSKWFPNVNVAVYDWAARGFIVIIDEKLGGGFNWKSFPEIDLNPIIEKYSEKFRMEF